MPFLLLVVLSAGFSSVPAWGGEGAGNLEARVAELEATAARSGNSKLSFRLYGQINRALLMWKDGFDSNSLVVDNGTSSSRFGFTGRAEIRPGLIAGYRFEVEAPFPSSDDVFNGLGGHTAVHGANMLSVRQSYWDLASKDLGRVAVGFQSPATDDITIINLGSQMNDAALHYNNAFRIRLDLASPPITTDLRWGQIAHDVDALRGNFVRYDTPILGGLLASSALNDDVWDVALRYQSGANDFRVAAGVGYMKHTERAFEDVKGSASLIHDPTGLYVSVAGACATTGILCSPCTTRPTSTTPSSASASSGSPTARRRFTPTTGSTAISTSANCSAWSAARRWPAGTLTDTEVRRWASASSRPSIPLGC
ncbi:MAG: porin [Rhodospirillales bacterium]|nr:porin [Rhodospirillales bacterium]